MRVHAVYLAVIAVLIIIIVYAAARAVRAGRALADIEARFGIKEATRASASRKGGGLRRASQADLLRPRTYDQYRREVDALLERAAATEDFGPRTRLSEACEKALRGGKRLRAVILLEVARATAAARQKAHGSSGSETPAPVDAAEAALFIEYVHAASLVIDDLPEFDNDATRRGRSSLHAEVGPAVAQLAALSLVAAAFQNVCRQIDWIRDNCPDIKNPDRIGTRVCNDASRALGAVGAAGGQYMDISSAEDLAREHGPDAVATLMDRKTATFFEIAVVTGWLTAGGDPAQTDAMRAIGRHVGAAFQIADDVGDMARDAARPGRPAWNFANQYGRDVAAQEIERNLNGARFLLRQRGLWTALWENELFPMVRAMADAPAPTAGAEEGPGDPSGLPREPASPDGVNDAPDEVHG